jgi:hypothetical protein
VKGEEGTRTPQAVYCALRTEFAFDVTARSCGARFQTNEECSHRFDCTNLAS